MSFRELCHNAKTDNNDLNYRSNQKLGSQVIQALIDKNVPTNQIVALVRDQTKATHLIEKGIAIRIGDYDNRSALQQAMKGIDKVLLVSGLDVSK